MLANSKGQSLTDYTAIEKWLLWKIIWQGIVNVIVRLAQQLPGSEKNWYIEKKIVFTLVNFLCYKNMVTII